MPQEKFIGDGQADLMGVTQASDVPGLAGQIQTYHIDAKHFTPDNAVAMGAMRHLRKCVLAGNMETVDETVALVMKGYVRDDLKDAVEAGDDNLPKRVNGVIKHLGAVKAKEKDWNTAFGSRRQNPYEWESLDEMTTALQQLRTQLTAATTPDERQRIVQEFLSTQKPEYETHILVQVQQIQGQQPQVLRAASVDIALQTGENPQSNAVVGYWGFGEGDEEAKNMTALLTAARDLQKKVSARWGVDAGLLFTELDPQEEGNPGAVETVVANASKGEIPLTVIDPGHRTPESSILKVDGAVPMQIAIFNGEQASTTGEEVGRTLTHFAKRNYGAEGPVLDAYTGGLSLADSYDLQ
jgi:hypothetical protein